MHVASKLPTIQKGKTSSKMPQSGSSNKSPPLAPKKKRKRYDKKGREKVEKVRRLGACFRCKIIKLPVGGRPHPTYSMTDMCVVQRRTPLCKLYSGQDGQKIYRGPCVRLTMDEVHTFRAADGDHGNFRAILPKLQWVHGRSVKTVKLH